MKTKVFFTAIFSLFCAVVYSQISGGSIKCTVQDKITKEVIPFSHLVLYSDSVQVGVAISNMDGEALFSKLPPGIYNIKAVYVGYSASTVNKIKVQESKTQYVQVELTAGEGAKLQEVEVVEYSIPLIDPDTKAGNSITREEYYQFASKDISSVAATSYGACTAESNTEEYAQIIENNFKNVSQEPLSTLSIDVDRASYANVRRFLNAGQLPPPDAVRVEEMINYFNYDYPQPKNNEPFSVQMNYASCPWNKEHGLVHIGIKARNINTDAMPPANFVFLVDVSGSMDEPNKLPLLKSALQLLVDQLRPQDRISLVVYAGNAGLVLNAERGNHKIKIREAIDKLEAGGSTAGGEGIVLAYKVAARNFNPMGNNRVVLATDGDFNVGVSSDEELVKIIEKKREEGVFLSVLGFGSGNYKDSKMEKLADKGNGNYAYIDNILEAKKVLVSEMGGTLLTLAKDVKIQVEFNPNKVKSYRLVGYENRVLNKEDFNDDKKDAGELGAGHCVTALYEIIPAGSAEEMSKVDSLKYQQWIPSASNELLTLKTRYKQPNASTSNLNVFTLQAERTEIEKAPENIQFAAAVAGFGMLLRESQYSGSASYQSVSDLARKAKGRDDEGYRAEFIKLVETAELLNRRKEVSVKEK